jgi:hypothetical protein
MALHINMTSVLIGIFMVMFVLPLPILLFFGPLNFIYHWVPDRIRYRHVKRYYIEIDLITIEQLQVLYPSKNEKKLLKMYGVMAERYDNIRCRLEYKAARKLASLKHPN